MKQKIYDGTKFLRISISKKEKEMHLCLRIIIFAMRLKIENSPFKLTFVIRGTGDMMYHILSCRTVIYV